MSSLTTTDRSGRQDVLTNVLTTIAGQADACWWHLNGNNNAGYNESSLSHLLGTNHDDVVPTLERRGRVDRQSSVDELRSWNSQLTGLAKNFVN